MEQITHIKIHVENLTVNARGRSVQTAKLWRPSARTTTAESTMFGKVHTSIV